MKRCIIIILIFFCCHQLFSQNIAVVWANYNATTYMDTLNGKKIIFPEFFVDSIQRFGITKYYQSFPFSKINSLKSNITFECPIENAEEFANFLQLQSSLLFSNIGFELPSPARFNYVPTDAFWNETKQITTFNGQNTIQETIDNLWHLKIIEADSAWNITQGDTSIKIAVIDYGFDITHPDLQGKVNYKDPFDYDPAHPLDYLIHNANTHGTKVACIAAGKTNGGGKLASIGFNCGLVLYNSHYPGEQVSWLRIAQKAHHAAFSQNASVIVLCMDGTTGIHQV